MKIRSLLLTLAVFAVPSLAAVKSMEAPRHAFDRAAHNARMIELQQRLGGAMVALAEDAPLRVVMTAEELRGVRQRSGGGEMKMAVGVVRDLHVPMAFERLAAHRVQAHETFGATRGRGDGSFDWSGVLASDGAAAVRIHFTDFDLPAGAELYVFARNGMAFGPYTGRGPNGDGDFWTNTIAGEELIVHLTSRAGAPRFTIAGLGHLTDAFKIARSLVPDSSAPCPQNSLCVVDAACATPNAAVDVARNAVAHILFLSGPGGRLLYICSGGLVADSDPATDVPYFITANHCIGSRAEASSMETYFFYAASSCGACPSRGMYSTTGATLLTGAHRGDVSLLRLNMPAPAGAAFLGWTTTPVALTDGEPLFRLSHPRAAPQSYSEHVVDISKPACRSWPRGLFIYSRDTLGAIEPGSSGAPVVNAAGQLVGQLSGICGSNDLEVCDSASNATVDGAFAESFDTLSRHLAPAARGRQ
jgi:lysyl endopeptidase